MKYIDIYSKGEVVRYLQKLQKGGQINDCIHIKAKQGHANAFYPECDEDWARRVPAKNVHTDMTGYGAPSSYHWPECPGDCELYEKADDFVKSIMATEKVKVKKPEADNYVAEDRIGQLRSLPKDKFDTTKLVELCEELNQNYKWKNYFAVGALLRTILHHVPPVFGMKEFKHVASDYSWGKSHKNRIMKLSESAKDIADNILHEHIRKLEVLPKKPRVDFKAELDILLAEIVTILNS